MSFTYNLTSSGTSLLVSKVRMHLGDNVLDEGVLPSGSNLEDEEIEALLTEYSDDVGQTVGACCAMLARRWANAADISVGPRRENLSQISKRWAEMGDKLNPSHASFSIGAQRSDGYADYADDDDSEYT